MLYITVQNITVQNINFFVFTEIHSLQGKIFIVHFAVSFPMRLV
jgi:hypothetical protein